MYMLVRFLSKPQSDEVLERRRIPGITVNWPSCKSLQQVGWCRLMFLEFSFSCLHPGKEPLSMSEPPQAISQSFFAVSVNVSKAIFIKMHIEILSIIEVLQP